MDRENTDLQDGAGHVILLPGADSSTIPVIWPALAVVFRTTIPISVQSGVCAPVCAVAVTPARPYPRTGPATLQSAQT